MSAKEKVFAEIERGFKVTEEWILSYYERRAAFYAESRYIRDCSYGLGYGQAEDLASGYMSFQSIQYSELDNMERWLLALEIMWEELPLAKRVFVEQRRRAEKKNQYLSRKRKPRVNWALFVQEHYAKEMARKCGGIPEDHWKAERTIKLWWKEIVERARLIAIMKGCIF